MDAMEEQAKPGHLDASRKDLSNAIRALAMDAVQKANSGHPGMPMGMAEIAEVLWRHHLRHNPADPGWANRDRFVISNGHGCMLQYALLHLTGYDLPIEEIKRFRQLHSKTPGHPEYGLTPGVETTTGPLGQGLTNAVGMALAEKLLAAAFNRPGFDVVEHHTYVFLGDGCMMEGISHEACSLAGTLGLGKLIALYDDNGISIDSEKGRIDHWFSDDTPKRFEAYGWHVVAGVDGHGSPETRRRLNAASPRHKLTAACEWLQFLGDSVRAAHQQEPVSAGDLELLRAIPASRLPARQLPDGSEPVTGLSDGVITAAERARHAAWASAKVPPGSPAMTVNSWRRVAAASTLTGHHCEILLRSLADRANDRGPGELSRSE